MSCKFLTPGGSMVPRYISKLLVVSQMLNTQQPLKLEKTQAHIWNPYNFRHFLIYVSLNLKTIKFYTTKLSTDFYWQKEAIYWVKEPQCEDCLKLNLTAVFKKYIIVD